MSRFDADTLDAWLTHLEGLHHTEIDMGLARVEAVRAAMGMLPAFPLMTVGGTNGKGSVCAFLSTTLSAAGYRVGTFTSPHLLHYNERIAIDLAPVADEAIVAAFRAIEAARGDISLTYFEFGTLAAMHCFMAAGVDIAVLEVGLGGRLDAVNIFDADVAGVVSIDLDHEAYLGSDREAIGFEKAGIFRRDRPAFCADPNPPQRLIDHAAAVGAPLQLLGRDFGYQREAEGNQWMCWTSEQRRYALPLPALRGAYQLGNAALAIAMLDTLRERLPVSIGQVKRGLLEVEWPGRCQVLPGRPQVVLDVAHNPHAAKALASALDQMGFAANRHAVFGMMADKDIAGVVALLKDRIDHWHLAAPQLPRAATADVLADVIATAAPQATLTRYDSIAAAWQGAVRQAGDNDRILAFGSFYTVAEVLAARGR
ncbi:bifunctional folylpolyglutamate synthase/dihydrofolate synthase [Jeongeupia sp. HS-3]|uniref:bifunctional tetrahydrofolate synthase/dihydrofolate synthase n=1 Tax=Jeongeupia sp. HS-3 TaxID=1009682 RepID=UPI0018A4A42F|nr:bifunctional tetrahydrofolate synthase/dihydrofolate synthase [Jeongeupia sp. HS-3]BCL75433.1 bifunctional folylpolyglutamate synthase/dihydrofolate synthase [Jeongeupia sp. HS-3]